MEGLTVSLALPPRFFSPHLEQSLSLQLMQGFRNIETALADLPCQSHHTNDKRFLAGRMETTGREEKAIFFLMPSGLRRQGRCCIL